MPDKPLEQACDARVCIHTDQILDSCMDKDCVEDLRVYLTRESQAALDRSTGAKTRCAELLFARVEVEPLAYKRGHYAVDLTFYYRILGDATVGERVNFGCGTVVVNYDGYHKYRTEIGDDCFIGCNTNLVSPVKLGDRAFTAAGTTVTKDVPAGALSVARSRQTNLEGWNDRRRAAHEKDEK